MTHWIVREWLNAIILAMSLTLTWRFLEVRANTERGQPRRDAATALAILFAGEAVRSGWAWVSLMSRNRDWASFEHVQGLWGLGAVAAAAVFFGATCALRVFGRSPGDSYAALICSLVLAALFLGISILT